MLTAQTSPGGVRTNRHSPGGVRNKHRHPTRTPNTCGEGRQAPDKTNGSSAACGKRKNRRPAATARVRQTRQCPRTGAPDRQSAHPNPGVPGKRPSPANVAAHSLGKPRERHAPRQIAHPNPGKRGRRPYPCRLPVFIGCRPPAAIHILLFHTPHPRGAAVRFVRPLFCVFALPSAGRGGKEKR